MTAVARARSRRPDDALRVRVLFPIAAAAACGAGLAASKAVSSGHPVLILGLAAIFVPVALWRWPVACPLTVLALATTIEQFSYAAGAHKGVFTSRIRLFGGVTKGSGISLFEFLLGMAMVVWLFKGALDRHWYRPRGPMARALAVLLALVFMGVGVGLAHGGKLQIILYEVRPWLYIALTYLLASSLLRTRAALRAVLWVFVLGVGFKSLQGVMMYLAVRHDPVPPELILSHEESFFFGIFLIFCIALWVFGIEGRLRTVATWLVPAVLLSDMANSRRTAWAIIGTTVFVVFAVAYASLRDRRHGLRRGFAVLLVVSAGYFPVFWSKAGLVAQPARALHSQIAPDARDKSSDLYRTQEAANLAVNIRATGSRGKGFGVLINYSLPITDISGIDPFIAWLPHNSVLDLWMRLGIEGVVALLFLLAAAIVRGCALIKTNERELAVLGVLAICAVVAYVVQGYNDLGFFWFRMALCMGTLLGAVEAGYRMGVRQEAPPIADQVPAPDPGQGLARGPRPGPAVRQVPVPVP